MQKIEEILKQKVEQKPDVPENVMHDLKVIFEHNDSVEGRSRFNIHEAVERFAEMGFKATPYLLNKIAQTHFGRKSWKYAG